MDALKNERKPAVLFIHILSLKRPQTGSMNPDSLAPVFFNYRDTDIRQHITILLRVTRRKTAISAQMLDCRTYGVQKVLSVFRTPKGLYSRLKGEPKPINTVIALDISDKKTLGRILNIDA